LHTFRSVFRFPADDVAERILAVAKQKSLNEMWMAKPIELLLVLYFATYCKTTAFRLLARTVGKRYTVAARDKNEEAQSSDAAKAKAE